MNARYCTSLVFVRDIGKSKKFYEEVLSQRVEIDHGACVAFAGGFAIMEIGLAQEVIYGKRRSEQRDQDMPFEFYFETEDLEAMHQFLKDSNVKFIHEIMEMPWKQRSLHIYDPDGNIIEIGEHMDAVFKRLHQQGMSIEEIAQTTAIPADIVKKNLI